MELRIAAEMDLGDHLVEVRDAIHTAIDTYRNEAFLWNETRSEWTTSAGQTYYTAGESVADGAVPSDIQWVQDMKVRVSGNTYQVQHRNFWELNQDQVSTDDTGDPRYWSWHGNAIRLYPTPDAAYPIEFAYIRDVSADSGPTAGESWFTRGELMIRSKAKSLLHAHVKQLLDPNESMRYEGLARQEFRRIKGEYDRLTSTDRLSSWGY